MTTSGSPTQNPPTDPSVPVEKCEEKVGHGATYVCHMVHVLNGLILNHLPQHAFVSSFNLNSELTEFEFKFQNVLDFWKEMEDGS